VLTELDTVRTRIEGVAGRITLNRPAALNALDLGMIRAVRARLDAWRDDPRVSVVVLDGAGERAFCAGGDIVVVHRSAGGDHGVARELWRTEYQLDAAVARYPKPVVALLDGITMGGGLGIGGHVPVRVVTERSVLAMPEVAIGLAPDVGGLLLFARAPGQLGAHLALTAGRVGTDDAVYCGLADHVVTADRLPALCADLARLTGSGVGAVRAVVARHAVPPGPGSLRADRPWIDECYAADSVAEVVARLRSRPERGAAAAVDAIGTASPTALAVTLRALRNAERMRDIEECLRQDYRVITRFLGHPDLREGIRAAVLDKDHAPRWQPAVADVDAFFAPLGDDELDL
jgi:enoyl-CoA hydratase/carnithine racemase